MVTKERLEELETSFREEYENPNNRCTPDGDGKYSGIKRTYDLDEINFKRIPGFECCTEEEIEALKKILEEDTFTWVKKTDLE